VRKLTITIKTNIALSFSLQGDVLLVRRFTAESNDSVKDRRIIANPQKMNHNSAACPLRLGSYQITTDVFWWNRKSAFCYSTERSSLFTIR